jgi:hypothetical protein
LQREDHRASSHVVRWLARYARCRHRSPQSGNARTHRHCALPSRDLRTECLPFRRNRSAARRKPGRRHLNGDIPGGLG